MAPWTLLLRAIEGMLYGSAHRLSSMMPLGLDLGPAADPLAPPEA
jgi:hypothetical protein